MADMELAIVLRARDEMQAAINKTNAMLRSMQGALQGVQSAAGGASAQLARMSTPSGLVLPLRVATDAAIAASVAQKGLAAATTATASAAAGTAAPAQAALAVANANVAKTALAAAGAKNVATGSAQRLAAAADVLRQNQQQANTHLQRGKTGFQHMAAAGDKASSSFSGFLQYAKAIAVGMIVANSVMAVAGAMGSLVSRSFIGMSSDIEQASIAFETMTGSAKTAQILLRDLKAFAAETPFTFPQVLEGAKRLMAFNISAKDLVPTLNALGNISAGVGTEKLPQLILAFGQVKAAGHLTGMELRQFTEAGVPLLEMLATKFGKTTGEVQKMVTEGKIGFKDVREALFSLSEPGNKFFNLMQKQSTTLIGALSNVSDRIGFFMSDGLKPLYESLKSNTNAFADFLKSDAAKQWAQDLSQAVSTVGNWFKALWDSTSTLRLALSALGMALQPVWDAFKTLAGGALLALPSLVNLAGDMFARFIARMIDLGGYLREHAGAFIALAAAIGSIFIVVKVGQALIAFGTLVEKTVLGAKKAMELFEKVIMSVSFKLFLLALPFAAVMAAVALFLTNFMGFRDHFIEALAIIREAWNRGWGAIHIFFNDAAGFILRGLSRLLQGMATFAQHLPGWGNLAKNSLLGAADAVNAWAMGFNESSSKVRQGMDETTRDIVSSTNEWKTWAAENLSTEAVMAKLKAVLGPLADKIIALLPPITQVEGALGGEGGSDSDGLSGAAEKAKTLLQQLELSAESLRKAMDLLGMSVGEQTRILTLAGENLSKAGELIPEVGATVAQLAAVFNAAGLEGQKLADQVMALAKAAEAEKEAKKIAEELRQAQDELTRATEEYQKKLEGLADTMLQRVKPAFERVFAAISGGFSSAQIGAFGGSVSATLAAGVAKAREAAGVRVPGFAEGVRSFRGGMAVVGERGPELVNLPRGSDVLPISRSTRERDPKEDPAVVKTREAAKAMEGASKALDDHQKALKGTAEGWQKVADILGKASVNIANVAVALNGATLSAEKAAGVLGGLADELVDLFALGGDTSATMAGIAASLGVLGEQFKFLTGAELAAAGAMMDAANDLVTAFNAGEISAEQFRWAMEKLEGPLTKLGQSADKMGEALTSGITEKLKSGMQPLEAIQSAFQEAAKAKWIEGLQVEVQKRMAAINAAIAAGLDPSAEIEKSKALLATYRDALRQTEEEIQALGRETERLADIAEREQNAVGNFVQKLSQDAVIAANRQRYAYDQVVQAQFRAIEGAAGLTQGSVQSANALVAVSAQMERIAQREAEARAKDRAARLEREQRRFISTNILNVQSRILGLGRQFHPNELGDAQSAVEEAIEDIGSGQRRGPGGLGDSELRRLFAVMAQELMRQWNPTITLDDGTIAGRVSHLVNERSALQGQMGGGF